MSEFLPGAGYQADIGPLRRDYPAVGWTPFAVWRSGDSGPEADRFLLAGRPGLWVPGLGNGCSLRCRQNASAES